VDRKEIYLKVHARRKPMYKKRGFYQREILFSERKCSKIERGYGNKGRK